MKYRWEVFIMEYCVQIWLMSVECLQENNRSELERIDRERNSDFQSMLRGFVVNQVKSISLIGSVSCDFQTPFIFCGSEKQLNPLHPFYRQAMRRRWQLCGRSLRKKHLLTQETAAKMRLAVNSVFAFFMR